MRSVVRDLKDRKVVQWALAYLAGAWVVLQVLDVLAEVWALSVPLQQGIQLLLATGLLVVLVLAWYHGEKGRQRVSGPELLIITALLGISGGILALLRGGADAPAAPPADAAPSAAAGSDLGNPPVATVPGPPAAPSGDAAAGAPDRPSIAVLAFDDLSPGGDQGYFADGVAEEILNALAKISGLKVAARTSAFSFRGSPIDVRTIGERLGVETVLEGSVRKEERRVRLTAQLISVADGFHLWSAEYDREIEGVFAVQEEIAREIVEALALELGGEGRLEAFRASETSPEAYQTYLKARHDFHDLTLAGFERALTGYDRAIELDPTFAPAHAGRAAARYAMGHFGAAPYAEMVSLARREARRALELDDGLAEARAVLAYVALYHDWEWEEAERQVLRALAANPNDVGARHAYADLLMVLGNPEEALRQAEAGRRADPLSFLANVIVVGHLSFLGRFEEVLAEIRTLRERFPDRPNAGSSSRAPALWSLGRFEEALEEYRKLWSREPDLYRVVEEGLAAGGPRAAMRAWGDHLARRYESGRGNPLGIANAYARAGADEDALRWLERAYEEKTPALLHVTADPDYDALRDDPRFRDLLRRIGIPR